MGKLGFLTPKKHPLVPNLAQSAISKAQKGKIYFQGVVERSNLCDHLLETIRMTLLQAGGKRDIIYFAPA